MNPPRFLRNRRGVVEHLLWTIVWTAVFIMVVVALQLYLARIQSTTRFERIKLATDLALTAQAAPVPAENYAIPLPAQPYTFYLDHGTAAVQALEEAGRALPEEKALFGTHPTHTISTDHLPAGVYLLAKDGTRITITPKHGIEQPSLPRLSCPLFTSSRQIVIDPGHGGTPGTGNPGAALGSLTESDATTRISQELATQLAAAGFTVSLTRPDNTPLTMATRTSRIPVQATLVSIHVHPGASEQATVTAIINPDAPGRSTSAALACSAINALLAPDLAFHGANILPVSTWRLPPADDRHVLDSPQAGVYLIISGLQSSSLGDTARIAKHLSTAFTPTTP